MLTERLDKPEGWGKSYFWYCVHCSKQYAFAKIPERKWQGVGGCCLKCSARAHKYLIAGNILDTVQLVGETVPSEILRHQLRMELIFLSHQQHPYNEKEC